MSIGIIVTVYALVFPAELPDKTFIATMVLSTRSKPLPVLVGAAGGFALQCAFAVLAGSLVTLAPHRVVLSVSAALFLFGAFIVLREPSRDEEEAEVGAQAARRGTGDFRRSALTAFLVIAVAELGDLTQLLTISLTAKYDAPGSVFVGSLLALVSVAALGVTAGRALLRVIPLTWLRRIAAVAMAVLALLTSLDAAGVIS